MEAIKIRNLSKRYKIYHQKELNLKYTFLNFITGKKSSFYDEFWALKNVSMDIKKGQTVGIIGENGGGKSTLLKLMAGILYPDEGTLTTHGKIATLIEIGAGFHPELSGRENVYINGAVLGFQKKEIDHKFEQILEFSGLEKFIDNPIKTYSSGMYVRLGFSIAINVNPDILLVDEILAVGDENFQKKCLQKIGQFKEEGKTIVLVSHDLGTIEKMCDHTFLLDDGKVSSEGNPADVISDYYQILHRKGKKGLRTEEPPPEPEPHPKPQPQPQPISTPQSRWGSGEAQITGMECFSKNGEKSEMFQTGNFMKVRIHYEASQKIENPVFGLAIYREGGIHINGPNTKTSGYRITSIQGKGSVDYIISSLPLTPGAYYLTAAIVDDSLLHTFDHWHRGFGFTVVENKRIKEKTGVVYIPAEWRHHGER